MVKHEHESFPRAGIREFGIQNQFDTGLLLGRPSSNEPDRRTP
jgi:hypothetical protein